MEKSNNKEKKCWNDFFFRHGWQDPTFLNRRGGHLSSLSFVKFSVSHDLWTQTAGTFNANFSNSHFISWQMNCKFAPTSIKFTFHTMLTIVKVLVSVCMRLVAPNNGLRSENDRTDNNSNSNANYSLKTFNFNFNSSFNLVCDSNEKCHDAQAFQLDRKMHLQSI